MKNIVFIAALLFSAQLTHAQFRLGVRGGLINTSLHFSKNNTGTIFDDRIGLIGGLLGEIRINEGFAIQPELNYVQRNWKNTAVFTLPFITKIETTTKTQVQYVEVPLLLKGGFNLGPVRLDVLAGPSFSLAVKGKDDIAVTTTNLFNNTSTTTTNTQEHDLEQDYKKSDINAQAGAALSFQLGGSRFFVDGRYIYGLTNLSNTDDVEFTNRGVAITAGLLFGF